jgi:hypothetical protein
MNSNTRNRHISGASRDMSYEERSAVYDDAKRRAQALRREAVSTLIDDMIAWAFRRGDVTHRATNVRSEVACQS